MKGAKSLRVLTFSENSGATEVIPSRVGDCFRIRQNYNGTARALSSAQLSLPLPTTAGSVAANGGGVLGTDGVVRWTLSSVPAEMSTSP